MSKKLFRLVHVIDALATASCMLGKYRSNRIPSWADAQDQRVLGTDGFFVFGVALDDEVEHSLLVLMLH